MHSPSGAGKTSLIQAALLPQMEKEGFRVPPEIERPGGIRVRPVIRLTQPLPGQDSDPANRYVFSTLVSLEEMCPAAERFHLDTLRDLSLEAYLKLREPDQDDRSVQRRFGQELWVFDQFEEVITLDDSDQEIKGQFFEQLGRVLRRNKNLWVLFAMREEFLGVLDPYLGRIPTRLSTTYRLDLLGTESATEAVMGPAADRGVNWDEKAAEVLVNNLRRVRARVRDGYVLGPYVEPVQLQVVCRWLWERLPANLTRITPAQLEVLGKEAAAGSAGGTGSGNSPAPFGFGAVDTALAGYYDDSLKQVVGRAAARTRRRRRDGPARRDRAVDPRVVRLPAHLGEGQPAPGHARRGRDGWVAARRPRGPRRHVPHPQGDPQRLCLDRAGPRPPHRPRSQEQQHLVRRQAHRVPAAGLPLERPGTFPEVPLDRPRDQHPDRRRAVGRREPGAGSPGRSATSSKPARRPSLRSAGSGGSSSRTAWAWLSASSWWPGCCSCRCTV